MMCGLRSILLGLSLKGRNKKKMGKKTKFLRKRIDEKRDEKRRER